MGGGGGASEKEGSSASAPKMGVEVEQGEEKKNGGWGFRAGLRESVDVCR